MKNAIILAAGLGTRMRPLTDKIPKPLVKVGGQPLIRYCFEQLADAGISNVVVNVHHLADQIKDYVKENIKHPTVEISDESACLLNSGGAIKQALSMIDGDDVCCFFIM